MKKIIGIIRTVYVIIVIVGYLSMFINALIGFSALQELREYNKTHRLFKARMNYFRQRGF